MPEIAYGGTVTFNPNFSLENKNRLIKEFDNVIAQHLSYKGDYYYRIAVAREYHKVKLQEEGIQPDYEAPHLHFILYTQKPIAKYRVSAINEVLRLRYGRSQFYRMTSLKTIQYEQYIYKEVEKNDEVIHSIKHYYEKNLEEPETEIDYFEEINYEDYDDL